MLRWDQPLHKLIGVKGKESGAAIARAAAFRGESDRAFEWLDKASADSLSQPLSINVDPFFNRLHSDPRWLAFLRKHGRAPEQLAAIEFTLKPLPQSDASSALPRAESSVAGAL